MRIVIAITTFAAAAFAFGHHSVAMYDNENLITLSGTVTKVEWTSPHVFLFFSSAADGEPAIEWSVELDPPVLLRRYGWRQQTVRPGDRIEFTGAPAKSGAPAMRGAIAVLEDGTTLRVWSRV
jgi:hypothetical protein